MKKLIFIVLAIMLGTVACDRDSNQASQEVNPAEVAVEMPVAEDAVVADDTEMSLITPADLSEEVQNEMYQTIFDYNQCMMASRLSTTKDGKSVENAANEIMSSCETHLDALELHLLSHNVNQSLVIGMGNKMRSRAARKLMTQGMNQMAAQAAAVSSAEQIKSAPAPAE